MPASAWATRSGEAAPAAKFQPCRRGHRGGNQAGIGQRRKLGEPDAVGKFRQQLARDRQGEPCLADAAGAGQGDEPIPDCKADDLAQFVVAPDQLGDRLRQIGCRHARSGRDHDCAWADTLLRARRLDADLAGELVTASGDRPDQFPLRPEGRAQRRNLRLKGVLLHDPVRPDARHQRVFADDGATRLDQRHQHVEGTAAQLQRLAVGKQLPAMRQHLETTEGQACRWFGGGVHWPRTIAAVQEISAIFSDLGATSGSRNRLRAPRSAPLPTEGRRSQTLR